MDKIEIEMWGNSAGVRLPEEMMEALGVKIGDTLDIDIDTNRIILKRNEDMSFEELFKDYDGEIFQTEVQTFEPISNEKW